MWEAAIIRQAILLLLAALFAWPLVAAWRTGKIRLRGGMTVSRHNRPATYWASLTVASLLTALVLAMAFGLIPPAHR